MLPWPRYLCGCGLFALLLLLTLQPADSNLRRRRMQRGEDAPPPQTAAADSSSPAAATGSSGSSSSGSSSSSSVAGLEDMSALVRGCGRLFIDGGSNTGESVRAFVAGGFFTCGLHSPSRQYSSRWVSMSRWQRVAAMQPLKEPSSFCIRSFEAAPEHMPGLREQQAKLRAAGADVRFVHGALSNVSAPDAAHTIVRYAPHRWGTSAVGLDFGDVHVGGKPVPLATTTVRGPSYDLRALLRTATALNSSSVIALKLDVEGSEWWLLEALTAEPELLCRLSYLFVEFHSTASAAQRARLAAYGLQTELFEALKQRVHAAMETPRCRLQIYWRSFWASCGDKQRFEWRTSAQVTDAAFVPDEKRG